MCQCQRCLWALQARDRFWSKPRCNDAFNLKHKRKKWTKPTEGEFEQRYSSLESLIYCRTYGTPCERQVQWNESNKNRAETICWSVTISSLFYLGHFLMRIIINPGSVLRASEFRTVGCAGGGLKSPPICAHLHTVTSHELMTQSVWHIYDLAVACGCLFARRTPDLFTLCRSSSNSVSVVSCR